MKKFKIFSMLLGLLAAIGLASCDEERELIIIEGNLPIKTTTLYMVGDATPNGWDIGNPTPLAASEEDPLVFAWEGALYSGEIKLCLVPGSWDNPFIRPAENQRVIGPENITDEPFIMHAGDPDEKWRVNEAGKYRLIFNLRDWTMSTVYLGALDGPTIEPIKADAVYIVGDATPNSWNIDNPTQLEKKSEYIFVYEGNLKTGEMKACTSAGDWGVPFMRPLTKDVKINAAGIESEDFTYSNNPDDKWVVEEAGKYRLTFDLENWKVKSEFLGEADPEEPTGPTFYIVGDATPNGWNFDDATALTMVSDKVFEYVGYLSEGEFKACETKGDWGAPFYRPVENGVLINTTPTVGYKYDVHPGDPDNKWIVAVAGYYRLVFDLNAETFSAYYLGEEAPEVLYIVGNATPNGWDLGNATPLSPISSKVLVYEGFLNEGEMKACHDRSDWGVPFIRPFADQMGIGAAPIENSPYDEHAGDPDNKWKVLEAGVYRLTFDLENKTFSSVKL